MLRQRTTEELPGHVHQFTSTTAAGLTLSRSICRTTLLVVAGAVSGLLAIAAPSGAAINCDIRGVERKLRASLVLRLTQTRTTCETARAVTRAFHRCGQCRRGICRTKVCGYSCAERCFDQSSTSFDGAVACERGRVLINTPTSRYSHSTRCHRRPRSRVA